MSDRDVPVLLEIKSGPVSACRLTDWEHGTPLKITDHDFKNFFKFG